MKDDKVEGKMESDFYKTRREFLTLISRRFYDKISHVRVKALKKFIKIVKSDLISLEPFEDYVGIL